jgi:protein-disulfide isomerase
MDNDQSLTKKQKREAKKLAKLEQKNLSQKQGGLKKFTAYGIVAAVLLAIVGFWWTNRVVVTPEQLTIAPGLIDASDNVKGNPQARVIITEYSDFQCPACAYYAPLLKQVLDAYPDEVALVYRHFPLKQIHFKAEASARASQAAAIQGKFWEMHDKLFEQQESWAQNAKSNQLFADYAQSLGLNRDQFERDMNSKETKARVQRDYLHSLALQINSTPTIYINDQKVDNPSSVEAFKAIIDPLLGAADSTPSATAQPGE